MARQTNRPKKVRSKYRPSSVVACVSGRNYLQKTSFLEVRNKFSDSNEITRRTVHCKAHPPLSLPLLPDLKTGSCTISTQQPVHSVFQYAAITLCQFLTSSPQTVNSITRALPVTLIGLSTQRTQNVNYFNLRCFSKLFNGFDLVTQSATSHVNETTIYRF